MSLEAFTGLLLVIILQTLNLLNLNKFSFLIKNVYLILDVNYLHKIDDNIVSNKYYSILLKLNFLRIVSALIILTLFNIYYKYLNEK